MASETDMACAPDRVRGQQGARAVEARASVSASAKGSAARDVSIVMGGQILQLAVGVMTSTLLARALGPDGYGVVNLLRSGYLIALTLSPLGLDVGLLKYLRFDAAPDATRSAVAARLRRLAIAVAFAVLALLTMAAHAGAVASFYPFPEIDRLAVLTFLALPFATDSAVLNAVYRSGGQVTRYALMTTYAQSVFRIFAIPVALWAAPTVAVVAAVNTAQIVLSAVLVRIDHLGRSPAGSKAAVVSQEQAGADLWRVLNESSWMCASMFLYTLMRSADLLFLGYFAAVPELGAYSALTMVSQLIVFLPMAASQTLGPRVASAFERGNAGAVKCELDRFLDVAAPASAFLFGGIAAFGPRLDLVFGSGFVFDPVVCLLLPLGQVLSSTLAPLGFALSMTGRHRAENVILLGGALILVSGCMKLAPSQGARGVAFAVAGAFLLVNVVRMALVRRVIGAWPGSWRHVVIAPLALAAGWSVEVASADLAPRTLAASFLACCVYSFAFAAVMRLIMPAQSRETVRAGLNLAPSWLSGRS